MKDNVKCYELYSSDGNLVITGTAEDIHKVLGVSGKYLYNRFLGGKSEVVAKGFEVVEVGRYRKVYDACKGHVVLCTGTIDEIIEELGISKNFAMYSAIPSVHKKVLERKDNSEALLLFKHDEMIIEYY